MASRTPQQEALRRQGLALRGRHDRQLDALAARAGARIPAAALVTALTEGSPLPGPVLRREHAPFALALATTWVGMGRGVEELGAGVAVYRQLWEAHGAAVFSAQDQRHAAQAAFLAGDHDLVATWVEEMPRLTDAVRSGLVADLANPVVAGPGARDLTAWTELFGARFTDRSLGGPRVDPDLGCLFDGLHLAPERSVDGPLVSVIVPAWRPEEGLVTSVLSILAQSHGNLEVLVVDDASGPEYAEIFARVEALDERVRLLPQEANGGSYLGRNAALEVAQGEWVTTQDADDWSHPERLAMQVAVMQTRPEAVASRSGAIRCRPDLTRQWFGYSPERMNASSLMVDREVLTGLGGFDAIRKGADSEMHERLQMIGEGVVDVTVPLAVTRLAEGSLSRADFTFGRHSPERVLFRSAFRHWHTTVGGMPVPDRVAARRRALEEPDAGHPRPPEVEVDAARATRHGARPFPVPRSFVRDLPHAGTPVTDYPVVVLAELEAPPTGSLEDVGLDQGPVGVLCREDLTRGREAQPDWSADLLEAATEARVDLLTDADAVHARTLVVLEPNLLALPALPLPKLTADRVLVCAVPPDLAAGEPVRDLENAGRLVRELTGQAPVWVARTEAEQRTWAADGWQIPLLAQVVAG